jgi:hypothetical protein
MMDTGQKILQKIKTDNVRPYPKWHFLFKRSVIWAVFSLSILLGSIASAVAMFQLRYAEWDLYQHFSHSLIEFALLVVPILWLAFLLGFTGFAYYYFRRTEQGYRYRTLWIIAGSIVLSIIGGVLLSTAGLPEKLEPIFLDNIPFYQKWQARKQRVWMSPSEGLLAGKITTVISDRKIHIEDLEGNPWEIDITDTVWRGRLKPAKDLKIKMLGQKKEAGLFIADEIRPWRGRRRMMRPFKGKARHLKKFPAPE